MGGPGGTPSGPLSPSRQASEDLAQRDLAQLESWSAHGSQQDPMEAVPAEGPAGLRVVPLAEWRQTEPDGIALSGSSRSSKASRAWRKSQMRELANASVPKPVAVSMVLNHVTLQAARELGLTEMMALLA